MSDDLIRVATTLPSCAVVGFAILYILYKMVDGDVPAAVGLGIVGMLMVTIYFCVWPPHPAVPLIAVCAVVVIMVLFPFVENYLDQVDLARVDVQHLERATHAYQTRPDNIAAQIELSRELYAQGFRNHAIALGKAALDKASLHVDPVSNRSVRDVFRNEERQMERWSAETTPAPGDVRCPYCQIINAVELVFCANCGQPHLLGLAKQADPGRSVFARLAAAAAGITLAIVAGASLGLMFQGAMLFVMLGLALGVIGSIIYWVTRPTKASSLGRV